MKLKSSVHKLMQHMRRLTALACTSLAISACLPALASALPAPGSLVTATPDRLHGLREASRNLVISYVSSSFDGSNATVFGHVAIPKTPPPVGGYPVIAWANGSTGLAPQCMPSASVEGTRDLYLNEWVRRGYAVVRTDYAGWGAAGPVPDLHGRSNAENLIDAVTAAHSLDVRLRNEWIAVGHSKGGGAVLWAAGLPDRSRGKYPLRGSIAIAPVGPGVLKFMTGVANGEDVAPSALPFVALTALSAKALQPGIDLQSLTSAQLQPQLDALRSSCLADVFSLPPLPPGNYLKRGAAFDEYARLFAAEDASNLALRVPVSVIQAENDETTVTPDTTAEMVRSLCRRGASVRFSQYAGQDHDSVITASKADAFEFASTALAGGMQKNNCL